MINAAGLALIKCFEGYARALPDGRVQAYLCPAGIWTIGWGTTGGGIGPGLVISREAAELLLRRDIQKFATGVLRLSPQIAPGSNRHAALTSFAYNLGLGAYQASTLRRLVNQGRFAEAAAQFGKWINAGGRPLEGLRRRRAAEAALFLA